MKRFLLLFVATLMVATLSAQEYSFSRDINYRTDDEYATKMCRLDIATPEGAKDAPVIVWFHGGGLTGGSKDIPQAIMRDGCVVVGLDKSRLERYGIDANTLKGIIPFSGQAITHFEERRSRGIANTQPVVDELSPMFHVRGDAAPILILSGDREMEMLGRYEENALMWRIFQLVKHPDATLYELDGYGHNMCEPAYPLLMRFVREHEKKNK